jgi:hypothetical protein
MQAYEQKLNFYWLVEHRAPYLRGDLLGYEQC